MATTVTELRILLQEQEAKGNGDTEVKFSYNYGDYWRTTVASSVDNVNLGQVVHSAYHDMDKVVDSIDEDDDADTTPNAAARQVLLLG